MWCLFCRYIIFGPHLSSFFGFSRRLYFVPVFFPGYLHLLHNENTPIQIYNKISPTKTKKKDQIKTFDSFRISAQSIERGYSLEPPQ